MKKILLFIALLSVFGAYAQFFSLTPQGFISKDGSDYIIIELNGTQEDIFKKTTIYLNSVYKNPNKVLNLVESSSINISGFSENAIRRTSMHRFDMDYNIVLSFKDGKIKIDSPSFALTAYNNKPQKMFLYRKNNDLIGSNFGIYGKKNKIRYEKAVEDLTSYFNKYIADLIKGFEKQSDNNW